MTERQRRRTTTMLCLAAAGLVAGGCSTGSDSTASAAAEAARAAASPFACPADAGESGKVATGPRAGGRLQIVTTVAPITSIVANIAGDRADVHGVVPEGTNSHTYEPKPSVAALMSTADIVFVNGLRLEDPTRELADTSLADQAGDAAGSGASGEVIELGTLTISPEEYLYDFSFPRSAGKPNPHLWTNPPMARCYATIAAAAMGRADPANAGFYATNLSRFTEAIDALDAAMRTATATVAPDQRELLTYHDAYAYFALHYGYRVIGAIQVSDFEEPTPKEVTELIGQIEREHVPAIFGSEVFPSPVLEQLADETGVRYVDSLRDDDLPGEPGDPDHSYLGLMRFDFVTIVEGLGGDASALRALDVADVVADHADYPQ